MLLDELMCIEPGLIVHSYRKLHDQEMQGYTETNGYSLSGDIKNAELHHDIPRRCHSATHIIKYVKFLQCIGAGPCSVHSMLKLTPAANHTLRFKMMREVKQSVIIVYMDGTSCINTNDLE
jgi:hypothetical protein